ncbi:MAG TPA: N-acetylneuraminate synthase family protein [bacterium]|nr:N-acetylneuraminate synthase family protein [bacterium]HPQ19888.1 N-acetylneuraminate synthase family protein [bacterium]
MKDIYEKLIDDSPKLILEIGINHNGSREIAEKMIIAAKKAGAFAVKFQTFKTDNFITKSNKYYEIFKRCELTLDDLIYLKKCADENKIIMFSTANEPSIIPILEKINNPIYKTSSASITYLQLFEKICKVAFNKPLIISTGGSYLGEIEQVINYLKEKNKSKIILFHCTSEYPVKAENINLKGIEILKKAFNLPVGFSDHSENNIAILLSLFYGCRIFEKHFTLDQKLEGPDHHFSITPEQAKKLINEINYALKVFGDGVVKPKGKEIEFRNVGRRYIVAKKIIKKGTIITSKLIDYKRTNFSQNKIEPFEVNKILGLKVNKNIPKDSIIKWSDFRHK